MKTMVYIRLTPRLENESILPVGRVTEESAIEFLNFPRCSFETIRGVSIKDGVVCMVGCLTRALTAEQCTECLEGARSPVGGFDWSFCLFDRSSRLCSYLESGWRGFSHVRTDDPLWSIEDNDDARDAMVAMMRKEHTESSSPTVVMWDDYFMNICDAVSLRSKDPNTKVGAVLIGAEKQVLGTGFNGMPMGVEDTPKRLERPLKYTFISHAEANAITLAARHGVSLNGASLYVNLQPCVDCFKFIIQAGIKRVMYRDGGGSGKWRDAWPHVLTMSEETGVELVEYEKGEKK